MTADIAHNERLEESESGPRQKQLNAALKKLGDVARYHGGALQGKQAQKVLDCNRDGPFEVLDCINDLEELHSKYSTALSCLADVSDALRDGFKKSNGNLSYALKTKKRHYLGIFPQRRAPPPAPPLLGTPYPKKKFSVYFAF